MCVPCCTSSDLLYITFILGHGQSDGSGVTENWAEGNMTAGKKKKNAAAAATALSDGINEETGQVVQLQSGLDRWEILSCERWHALVQIWDIDIKVTYVMRTVNDLIIDAWIQIPSN